MNTDELNAATKNDRRMIMIKLTDKLSVSADGNQYTLGTPVTTTTKDGKTITTMRSPTYYTTMAGCLKAAASQALKHGVSDGEITTLRGFLSEEKRLQDEFAKLLEPLDI